MFPRCAINYICPSVWRRRYLPELVLILQRPRRCCSSAPQNLGQVEPLLQFCVDSYYISPGQTNMELFQHGLSCSYGPLGMGLRRNLLDQWWRSLTTSSDQVFGIKTLNCSQNPPLGGAGPLGMVDLDNVAQILGRKELSREELIQQVQELLQRSPFMRTSFFQGALDQFEPSLALVNRRLPFGLAETGLCFQPPGSSGCPGEATLTSLVWFCSPRTSGQWLDHWTRQRLKWWRNFALSPSNFSSREVPEEETEAPVSRGLSIFYRFPWGQKPIETLSLRGNAELLHVHKGSKVQGRDGRKTVPHVVTVTGKVDLGMMAFLSDSLQQLSKVGNSKHGLQQRKVLKLHPALAPVKVALELGRGATAELRQLCEGLMQELKEAGVCVWPGHLKTQAASLEQMMAKYDEMGVLFTVVVSDGTLENGLLQVRSRDTTIKETVHVSETTSYICRHISAAHSL
ncbi:DNA polymerase subunit gamma-2, mitochondrial [Takifugu rubripes]|uniref:DNA polymerase subunit gamma-2, mitochondrial n=1 Tax=Takifugu rubripes TaxID=31033 RepID=UPI0011457DAC|nr:DNA polymerase subunit gamma-2, mitochondrial [Takifugu rubripes]XP_029706142.1 DNA polymerase subunit gamma-2, mitochondrial [Takifugu rubripes]